MSVARCVVVGEGIYVFMQQQTVQDMKIHMDVNKSMDTAGVACAYRHNTELHLWVAVQVTAVGKPDTAAGRQMYWAQCWQLLAFAA